MAARLLRLALMDIEAMLTVIPRDLANSLSIRIIGRSPMAIGGGRIELDRFRA